MQGRWQALREAQQRHYKKLPYPPAKPWNPGSQLDQVTLIDASTYPLHPIFDLPTARLEDITDSDKYLVSPCGYFGYQNRQIDAFRPLKVYPYKTIAFNDTIALPMLIDMERAGGAGFYFDSIVTEKQRIRHGHCWMSQSPNECLSQWPGVVKARGKVVAGGLGLGWFLREIAAKDDVDSIVVVERSRELLDWYGERLCQSVPKVNDVICDDVYTQIGKHGNDAVYLLDIWPTQTYVNSDKQFLSAKRSLGKRIWGWGWTGSDF